MKNKILLLILLIFFSENLFSQQNARVIEDLVYKSDKLNLEIKYSIYLPPDYYTNNRSYPILYLLHGAGGGNNGWLRFGKINQVMDKMIDENKIGPFIIVMPTMGPYSFYLNWLNGPKWEDGFVEFVDYIDKNYRTIKQFGGMMMQRPARGICGISMGGYGALSLGFKHPDLFNSMISFSGFLVPDLLKEGQTPFDNFQIDESMKKQMDILLTGIFDKPFNVDYWNSNNPFNLINNITKKNKKVLLICGDYDEYKVYNGAVALHQLLLTNNINSNLEISSGKHNWDFWNEYLEKLLIFFDKSL